MYQVTLVNLTPDAGEADATLGTGKLGLLSPEAIARLLEAFRKIDPVQNAEAEPEIQLRCRGARYLVRTEQGRLLFRDAGDLAQVTATLTVAEILAELDGSAASARGRYSAPNGGAVGNPSHLLAAPAATTPTPIVTPAQRRARPLMLSVAAALLLAGNAALVLLRARAPEPEFVRLPSSELGETARAVAGVYVTGNEPGDRGLVVGADGAIRVFELNASGAPNFVTGTWQAGRIDGVLHLSVSQLQAYAKVIDRDTLDYCGERYRRAAAL